MGKRKSYQPWTQDQIFLMPPSMKEWLKEDHLAWFILDVVGELDISPIEEAIRRKDARGQRPYDPRMMVALLVYAYCTGVYSSRRMERACHENVAFRVITGNRQPYFTTINDFRRVHRKHFEALFVEVLKLCREAGLVKLRHVAVDGTKVKANASRHKAMSYKRLVAEEKRLRREVRRMLAEAEAADGADNARHGEGVRGDELPDELRRRESRLKRLREAKARLEAEARKARARVLREQAEGMEATAAGHDDARVRKALRTKAAKRRARADELDPPEEDPVGGAEAEAGSGALPRRETRTTTGGLPADGAQANFTDPESSIMKGADGFVQGYNAQLAVDDETQVIVAQGVTDQPPDNGNLVPMIERVEDHLDETPANATADAGYWNPEAEDGARALGTEAWVSTERQRHGAREGSDSEEQEETPDAEADPLKRMRSRLSSEEGRALYARRKAVVEPVNGQIKQARGFRQFSFRGIEAVGAEWALVCLCHNLLKMFKNRPEAATPGPAPGAAPLSARPQRDEASPASSVVPLYCLFRPARAPNLYRSRPKSGKMAHITPVNSLRRLRTPVRLLSGKRFRRTGS